MKTKKNANMFSMNALIIPSELRFAQSQYHTMNNDRRNTREKQMMKRFIGGVSSTHFSILACNAPHPYFVPLTDADISLGSV